MSAPERIVTNQNGTMIITPPAIPLHETDIEWVRADLCDPTQDGRVRALVDAAIAEDTAANKRVTSRERKQYIRGRIEALKDLRAALRALEQG